LQREERRHPTEANGQCSAPPGAAAGAAKFEPDFRKLRRTIFVTAETRRLHEAEDSRVAQGIHRLGGHALGLFRCKRP
jgi:hypothetical protein